jgi:hypothetical protein
VKCIQDDRGGLAAYRSLMNFNEAQLEFEKRYYLWSLSEVEREVEECLPTFWLFKGGGSWQTYQFIRQLSKTDQILYVHSALRSRHPEAAAALGHHLSEEHNLMMTRYGMFCAYQPDRPDSDLDAARQADEMGKGGFVSKAKVQALIRSKFEGAFGTRITEEEHVVKGDRHSIFCMTICEWVVQTFFWFGRRESCISYSHAISSADQSKEFDPAVAPPAFVLARSFCWTNLCVMEWEYLLEEDLEPACNSAISLCGTIFEALPSLLGGLERTRIEG